MKQKKTKVQQIVAIGSAVIIGTTSTVSAIPTTAFAKDDMEVSTEAYEQLEILDVVDEELKEEKQDTTENENVASENGETVKEKIDIESNTEETPDVEEANDEKTESDEKCENLNDVESKDEKVESSEKEEEIQGKSSVAKAVDVNEVIKLTKDELLLVDYTTDSKIADLLAPSRFLSIDILNKRQEIAKRNNVHINTVTDDDAKKELKQENVHIMSFEASFERVQKDIENIIPKLVNNSKVEANYNGDKNTYFTDKIKQNKEKILIGLAYLDRMYNFNIGDKNIKDVILDTPGYFGKTVDLLDWIISIGGSGGDTLKISNNKNAFISLFKGKITDSNSIVDFLETNVNKLVPGTTMDEWFKNASKAFIVETPSKDNPNATITLYSKLKSDEKLQSHIFPLLNLSEDSIYVIANSATITYGLVDTYVDRTLKTSNPTEYKNKVDQFKKEVEKAANQQGEFIDLWYRIAKPGVKNKLNSNRVVIDSLRILQSGQQNASQEWSKKFGDDVSLGIKEFITPMNMYAKYLQANAQADGTGMRLFMAKAVEKDGLSAYSHELTHLIEEDVFLNNEKTREGLGVEFYPRGLFETYSGKESVLNLNFIYDNNTTDRTNNASPQRFQTEDDMQQYTQRLLDVIYTLDYAEANVILQKDKTDKQKWFHKLEQEDDTGRRTNQGNQNAIHKIDTIRKISEDEADALKTIDDLVEQNIVASRYEIEGLKTTGKAPSNGYYVIPLFTSNYAGVQNDNGVSGDIMMRRQAHELLAEYGYYDGMVPYISNQYLAEATQDGKVLSDEYILNKIFKGQYASMTDFKKAMFEKRIEKLDELKPVSITWKGQSVQIDNFEKINQLMSQAVEDDLKNVQEVPGGWNNMRAEATQVEQLKKAIFIAYINDTDDFKESIYNEKAQVKKYTVSFDKNATDATGTMAAQEFEHGKEQVLSKNQFERIGYDFIGWKDINGNVYTDQQMVNNLVAENDGQITLFAQWKPIEYQVKFHKNHSNAVGTMENQKMVYDQSYQLNKNEFTLDGYEFKGWATSPNGQVVYKDEEIVTKLTDKSNHIIDLYSIWEKKPTPQPPAMNKAPVIVATDKVLTVGDSFDPLKDVTADDPEDGQIIIKSEHVIKNEVNTKVPGKYEVIYRVADKEGLATEKTIIVVVNPKITGINHVPVINATDKVLTVGDKFDPLDGVTAFDEEDKDITLTQANIVANNVNTSVAGTYNVTYKVTDKNGASTVKTITVIINPKASEAEKPNNVPVINATDKVLTVGDKFDPLDGVTAFDEEDKDITLTQANIIANNVDISVAGTYSVTYKVTDKNGASTVKTITVIVNPKPSEPEKPNNVPGINVTDKELTVGDKFNPLDLVIGFDEDGKEIKLTQDNIISNNVNPNVPGTYSITYRLTDKNGASTVKTITVIVNPKPSEPEKPNNVPGINVTDKELTVGDKFNPLDLVIGFDEDGKEIKLTQDNIISNNVNPNVPGTYSITYRLTDKNGVATVKTITVTVKAEDTLDKPNVPNGDTSKPNVPSGDALESNIPSGGTSKPNKQNINPQTGDAASVGLLGSIIAGSTSILALLLGNRKKKKDN